jgi:asparagine synthase (glutamine-hydrolysing)
MPVLFGQISADPDLKIRLPRSEHLAEVCTQVRLPGIDFGICCPPGIAAAECSFAESSVSHQLLCICDSELTNADELRKNLQQSGVRVQSSSAAELTARLVAQFGAKAFAMLEGSFRCAVWHDGRLYLGVDRFGIKRLSYTERRGAFRFGSRIDWLGKFEPEISLRAIYYYINMSYIPSPETIYSNVRRIPAGCHLVFEDGKVTVGRYWEMSYTESLRGSEDDLGAKLKAQILSTVKNTVADLDRAHTGCFLSGGTDSSTVLGMASNAFGQAPQSYTVGFAEESFSELFYSRTAAKHFGSKANEYVVDADDGWRSLGILARAFDQPFGNSSAVGSYFCAELAAKGSISVMLAGDGGDEIFGGNERYAKDKIYGHLHALPRAAFDNVLWKWVFKATRESPYSVRLENIFKRSSLENPERFFMEDTSTPGLGNGFLSPELVNAAGLDTPLELMRRLYQRAPAKSELNRLLFIDLNTAITDNDLIKVCDTAAACGVRVRYPFLERGMAEFSGDIPANLKLKGLKKRYLFKRALRDFLPPEVISKTKQGFGVPVSLWLRQDKRFRDLILDVTSESQTRQRGYVNPAMLQSIVDQHMRGVRDWGALLWGLLMLEMWHREAASAS